MKWVVGSNLGIGTISFSHCQLLHLFINHSEALGCSLRKIRYDARLSLCSLRVDPESWTMIHLGTSLVGCKECKDTDFGELVSIRDSFIRT